MKKPTTFKWAAALCLVIVLSACQKDFENNELPETNTLNPGSFNSGVIEDDPERVAKVPVIISSDYLSSSNQEDFLNMVSAKRPGTGGGGGGGNDRKAPSISISSPTNSATVAGTISIQVNASDNVGVSSVTLYVDGKSAGSSSASPFTISWNSATVPNGSHTLMVTAKDAAGNTSSSSIQVNVSNVSGSDITNPTVNISSPSNGSTVSGTVSITANASDNAGLNVVRFSINGNLVHSDNSSPYSYSWNTSSASAGVHVLTATAVDAAGNSSTHEIEVTVNTTVLPPTSLPASASLLTPTPGHQGNEGSCVPFAIAYGARSIEHFYKNNASSYAYSTNIFSPEYAYNQTKFGECGSGTSITTVLDLIVNKGVATWQAMPYSDVNGCSIQPTSSQDANAASYKIASYSKIPNTDEVAIKTMIASKHPVIATIIADNSFVNAKAGFIWRTYSGSGSLPHTLVICGYDDAKHAYKVMNSWGTGWADAGFSWIDYDFFITKSSYYLYTIQ